MSGAPAPEPLGMEAGKSYVDDICKSIQNFISQEFIKLQTMPDEEKPPAVFAMINTILTYSNNYMTKHTRDIYVLHGRILEKKEAAEKIKNILKSYENQKLTDQRLKEKIDAGEDLGVINIPFGTYAFFQTF